MELFTILMSGLLAAGSPLGLVVENIMGDRLDQRLPVTEELTVRIDNLPAHQIMDGEIDRLRIAARGVKLLSDFRLDTVELETDALSFDLEQLRQQQFNADTLREPMQAGVKLVFTETDLNTALRSPQIRATLQPLINRLLTRPGSLNPAQVRLTEASIDMLGENRFQFVGNIAQTDPQTGTEQISELQLAFTLNLARGSQVDWLEAEGYLDGVAVNPMMLQGFSQAMGERLNLQRFQGGGVTARFLQLAINEQQMQMAMFIRVDL